MYAVAIVLWGDRGLKPRHEPNVARNPLRSDRPLGRSRIETMPLYASDTNISYSSDRPLGRSRIETSSS